ncbi:AAA family ATPase [Pseudomonas putida]|uniref:AAA family ATPase n=1 Tax=Pseudomonas putida TaxID=303 RepID=A0A7Y7ZGA6_PSEPU|nr:MoxR family ATPase [Pseudomonas putida]NWC83843.1 AAA family ATPase [Pseudomonas putida]
MILEQIIDMSAFGMQNAPMKAFGFAAGHDFMHLVPKVDPHYKFDTEYRRPIMNFLHVPAGDALGLIGPTGCGKTSHLEQICARLNYPLMRVNCHSRMELPDLVGMNGLDCDLATGDQRTVFRHGPLALAMKHGFVFCLDESDVLPPEVTAGLNAVLEGAALVIAENGGEVIQPHENFRFVQCSNTRGQGDETGLYNGTMAQNLASWDRFRLVEFNYMSPDSELEVLSRHLSGAPADVLEGMVSVANEVRNQFVGSMGDGVKNLTVTFSTRTLIRWGRIGVSYTKARLQAPLAIALREALTNRCDSAQRLAIHKIAQDKFGQGWMNDPVIPTV